MESRYDTSPRKAPFSAFIATTFVIFFCTLSAAHSIGLVPYYIDGTEPSRSLAINALPELGPQFRAALTDDVAPEKKLIRPTQIRIDSIGLNLPVQNPETKDIAQLDELLKTGPARYVDSALLGEEGNMIIFAHSSRLPVVHNQMYKAFNRISELESGDTIVVSGEDVEYIYAVISVTKVNAEDAKIDLSKDRTRLTLVTCDTLTSKSSRFVLEAELVGQL